MTMRLRNCGVLDGLRVEVLSSREHEEDTPRVYQVRLLDTYGAYKVGEVLDVSKYELVEA